MRALNAELQQRLNGDSEPKITRFGSSSSFAPGDKVIQIVNNYDKEVFNGDIGKIDRIDLEESQVFIDCDGRMVEYESGELDEVSLAYAASIHESQGSEYPAVTREGTDYGEAEVGLAEKVAQVKSQFDSGLAMIVFDPQNGSVSIHANDGSALKPKGEFSVW